MADHKEHDLEEELKRLEKENQRLTKRLDRIIDQGDRQHKQFEKLNEHLQSYIDIIDDHVITVNINKDLIIESVSTAFSNAFGFKESEVKGKAYEFLLDSEFVEPFKIDVVDLSSSGLPWHGEIKHLTKAETTLWTDTIITPVYDDDTGEIVEYTILSKNITQEKQLKQLKQEKLSNKEYSQNMLDFMGSKSSALLQRASKKFSYTLWLLLIAIAWFILWANYTKIDELARGVGRIIPAMQIQKVQSVDGGRVEKIYVHKGSVVKKGDILFKLNEIESVNIFAQNDVRLQELYAKKVRLYAEANELGFNKTIEPKLHSESAIQHEQSLYDANLKQKRSKIHALYEKVIQHKNTLLESQERFRRLHVNFNLLNQEMMIKQGLLEDKIISKVEYLQLSRQKNELLLDINKVEKEITKAESSIAEANSNLEAAKLTFITDAKKELNNVFPEIERLEKSQATLTDHVKRTSIYAPVDGTINKVNVTTAGEVVRGGNILAEIVPLDDSLIVEVKINPSDIAFLQVDQEAMIKFTSYDFGIYGGLKGKIVYIGADTIADSGDGKNYYIIHIRSEKNYLGTPDKPLYIKVGMVTDVDILLGKKSVMDYILKPIMKAKQTALSER